MKPRRILALICLMLALVLSLALVSCGDDSNPSVPPSDEQGNGGNNDTGNNNGGNTEPTQVTVTFMSGTTVYETVTVNKGETVTPPAENPSEVYKRFLEWQKDGATYDFTTPVNENITLDALYGPAIFTVRFLDGETVLDTLEIEYGNTINPDDVPTAPVKPGKEFSCYKSGDTVLNTSGLVHRNIDYTATYTDIEYTVRLINAADESVIRTDTLLWGDKVPAYTAPIGYRLISVTKDGVAYDFETEIEGSFDLVVTLEEITHTVTYVCDSETIGTVTAPHGGRADLPTPPTGYFWALANVGDVCNITDDKTVTLTKVESSLYKAADTSQIVFTSGALTDEVKAKYSVVLAHSGSATKDPSLQSYALVLYQAGQTVEWKTDAAGKLRFVGNCDKKGQHITLGLYIDGYLWGEYQLDTPKALSWIVENVPAGMHTFRLEVLSATVDEDGEGFAGWSGLAFSQILYQELIPTTATVTFKNGSEVVDTVTVNVGETVSALATNPTKQYYLFKEWQKDGVAYDFTTAVNENIVLTAAFERDPAYVTVTFNNEGVTNTVFIEKNTTATAPTAPTKDGYTFGGWLLNGEVFDFETAVAEDITLTAKWTANSAEYTITFVDTEGTTIKTVKVLEGKDIDIAELPNAGTNKYYAASTEDWKKCFGVTQNQTITLTLCTAADDYSNWKETWITFADGVTQCQTAFNLKFCEDWWIDNGNAGKAQSAGRYLTISGDISYLRFGYYLSAVNGDTPGQSAVVKVYVDDCLVDTITFDNSTGTAAMQGKQAVTQFLAGQHTIKIEIAEGSCAITCLGVRQRTAATETSSAAQMQAILVDTKENGI